MIADNDGAPGNCPACGLYIHRMWDRHRAVCLGDPAVLAAVRAALDDGTGKAIRVAKWDKLPVKPCSGAHLRNFFGSWDKLAEALGLAAPGGWRSKFDVEEPMSDAERAALREDAAAEAAPVCLHGYAVRVVQVRPGVVHEYISLR